MATFTVTTLSDAAGASGLTLRGALTAANGTAAADSIVFAAGLTGSVVLEQGALTVTRNVTIDGGSGGITIDANGASRVLNVASPSADLTLENLTITHGAAGSGPGGGGILAVGPTSVLVLRNTNVVDNTAAGSGGGILANTVELHDSVVADNVANGAAGGGISARTVSLYQSTVYENTVTGASASIAGGGGGIFAGVGATVVASTIFGNEATKFLSSGGGIYANAVTVTNSTLADNSADYGGGAIARVDGATGSISILNATLTGNYAGTRGGAVLGSATIANSILVGNAAGVEDADISGSLSSNGHNLFGSDIGFDPAGDLTHVDPAAVFAATATIPGTSVLGGVLADNGGPTMTVALLDAASNPAIGRAELNQLTTDQRGDPRPSPDGHSDIGAFEVEPAHIIARGTPNVKLLQGSGDTEALLGLEHAEVLHGGRGHDLLDGNGGADRLRGGHGGDVLVGGGGADQFIFHKASHSAPKLPDIILDFSQAEGDRIVLRGLDGDPDRPGDQRLEFIGRRGFTEAGQVREALIDGHTEVRVNLDDDPRADMVIVLHDAIDLTKADFIL